MENNSAREPGLGPAAALPQPDRPVPTRSRARLLQALREHPGPTALAALLPLTGLHENTVREHLDALEEQGYVRKQRSTPSGRGRPAWLYTAADTDVATGRSEYVGLAAALASTIHRTSRSPWEDAALAGETWGHELVQERESGRGSRDDVGSVLEMLDGLGFAPELEPTSDEPDAGSVDVRLTRCPLLTAAQQYPDVVCGVHLGIVRGAIAELGEDPDGTELFPFSEPGACRLRLSARGAEGR